MMIGDGDAPFVLRHQARYRGDVAVRRDLLAGLVASEHISAGMGRVLQEAEHTRMGQATPQQLAVPGTAIGAAGKAQAQLVEALHHGVGGALRLEQLEHAADRTLHLPVGVEHDLVALVDEANREGKARASPLCALLSLPPCRRMRMICSSA